jgi:hypothetical protein
MSCSNDATDRAPEETCGDQRWLPFALNPKPKTTSIKFSLTVVGNPHECGFVPIVGVLPPNGTTSACGSRLMSFRLDP